MSSTQPESPCFKYWFKLLGIGVVITIILIILLWTVFPFSDTGLNLLYSFLILIGGLFFLSPILASIISSVIDPPSCNVRSK